MTTQNTAAYVSGPGIGAYFVDSSTDATFDGNNLLSNVGSAELGLRLAGHQVNYICAQYAAGGGAWKVVNRENQNIRAYGMMSKVRTQDSAWCYLKNPLVIQSSDILVTYPYVADSTSNQSSVAAWVETSKGILFFTGSDIVDSTSTEITSQVGSNSLGVFNNSILTGLQIQVEDSGYLDSVEIISPDGGTLWTSTASLRAGSGGSSDPTMNFKVSGLGIGIAEGMALKVTTVSA